MQRYNFFSIFPQLAEFYFLSWPNFVSSVGRISFPQLAEQYLKAEIGEPKILWV